jgi:thiol-disulfide isomerase/thioredoxin
MNRRRFLRGAAGAATAGLAGCLGAVDSLGGGNDGGEAGTIRTLDVAGSPGTEVPIRPAGEPALLDWWATWCAPCKPQMAEFRTVHEEFPDFHTLSITNESDEAAVEEFWREYDGTWPVAMDPELRTNDRYDATRTPTLLLLDGEGNERWRHVGLAAADTIVAEIEAL